MAIRAKLFFLYQLKKMNLMQRKKWNVIELFPKNQCLGIVVCGFNPLNPKPSGSWLQGGRLFVFTEFAVFWPVRQGSLRSSGKLGRSGPQLPSSQQAHRTPLPGFVFQQTGGHARVNFLGEPWTLMFVPPSPDLQSWAADCVALGGSKNPRPVRGLSERV